MREEYRGRGYGRLLVQELGRECLGMDGGRLEWSCLKWNDVALRFYKSLGAETQDEWVKLRVDGRELETLALGAVKCIERGRINIG